ncbi:putative cytochrome b5 [Mytilinidion resinicola]|uniref:Cytochrome b5 n=1 Tax=Mytilinidion resinicola TaxID=574789 RepID=A0A6A6YIW9_9PEZI|nr:putative cytochrome b5 [Mytilinidion resinicola]KAF2808802.1 putative cytochrome b5 [Mytilinidion resinicola]
MASPMKKFAASEVVLHKQKENLYLLIHDKVYDVSKFIDQHPGGQSVQLDQGGFDATEAFEEVGHSDAAIEFMKTLQIGVLDRQPGDEKILVSSGSAYKNYTKAPSNPSQWGSLRFLFAFVVAIAVFAAWTGVQR